ncbi:MAG: aldehyde dehydrogenase family protein [Lacunisphaera sp.]|nr:aldehyde dehydrogenase family protein [Lacunisphaera sp.]
MPLTEIIHDIRNLIEGQPCPAADGATFTIKSPATGEPVGRIAQAGQTDVDRAVGSAHNAFAAWSGLTAYERQKIIIKATAYARTRADHIGRLMALEQGKPLVQSVSEIGGSCDTLDYYAAEGVRIEGVISPTEDRAYRSSVTYQPVGVCALITPWNYPVSLLSWKLGPALATGCTVVVKPTTVTPMSPTAFCQALVEGGIPAGVINVLNGPGASLGEALMRHPLVKKIAMTGSTEVGKRIMQVVSPFLKKVSLELGGHCPAIVCADADLDLAAKIIAYKGFRNCGQSCSSVNRVYAHRSIHDALVAKLKAIGEKMTMGDGITDPKVDLGPMATAGGPETAQAHVDDAVKKGAALVTGGQRLTGPAFALGNYYPPTILTGCTADMLVMRDETFGPVVPFQAFETPEQAIALANDTTYGLAAYLFTKDHAATVKISEALEAGTVCVNHGAVNTNYGPYAGWKDSGYGLELSRKAVFEYLKTKHIKTAV